MNRYTFLLGAVGLLMVAFGSTGAARAQSTVMPGSPGQQGGGDSTAPISPLSHPEANDHDQDSGDDSKSKSLAPPPSLPGSHADPIPVAPPNRDISSMNPTDLLFDAINRGDITSVRDALGRGADAGAKNVLGQTPLALAVDLGRNEIAFLLLSIRNTAQSDQATAASPSEIKTVSTQSMRSDEKLANPQQVDLSESGFLGFSGNLPTNTASTAGQASRPN